jgi:hypothetical protein
MLMAAEVGSRAMFVESGTETCGDPTGRRASHYQPNCVSYRKSAEGPLVENAYNDCGNRTPTPCGTRAPGTIRVALMGTSIAEGFRVPYDETFAARLTVSLSRACGRPVEFQNMGVAGAPLMDVYHRTDEALAMHPDLVMLVVSAVELKERMSRSELAGRDETTLPPAPAMASGILQGPSLVARLSDFAAGSRALVVAQHFLFQDRATYVRLYMLHGEDADYLRSPLSPAWRERLSDFGLLLGGIVSKARSHAPPGGVAGDIPVMVIWSPTRIQVALLAEKTNTQRVDPFAIGSQFAEVSAQKGAAFVDALDEFARQHAPERFFYAVDGHMNGDGSAVFAAAVEERLAQGDIAPFSGCAIPRTGARSRTASPT